MGKSPDQIRQEIERTRSELGQDLDVLTEKVSPAAITQRRVEATRQAVTSVKEKVMGTVSEHVPHGSGGSGSGPSVGERLSGVASAVGGRVAGAAGSGQDRLSGAASGAQDTLSGAQDRLGGIASSAGDTASAAPQVVKGRAQGNPLAAGVIAFGVGWLASTLLPATRTERHAAARLKENSGTVTEPLKNVAQQAAQEAKETLAPKVQEAVGSLKETATDAASTVQERAQEATGTVRGTTQDAVGQVKDTATDAAGTVKESAQGAAGEVKGSAQDAAGEVKGSAQDAAGQVKETAQGGGASGSGLEATSFAETDPVGADPVLGHEYEIAPAGTGEELYGSERLPSNGL